ncbi:CoA transferase [Alcaligenaceae bacterium]|nr:CoA transferase [Alcaligenaceae bacterium]
MGLPLEGILVIAVEQAAAAPFASSRLADAGARVIKIERAQGDFSRGYDNAVKGDSTYFVWLNRGKESIVLDFANPEELALLKNMISQADVLIQNLGPGAAERAGFGWKAMREANPRLITCDITGYGDTGPYAGNRAYDLLVQAESGICSVTGTPETPTRIGVSACDIGTGMYAHAAILEALIARSQTGQGSAIQVSLFDSMTDWMSVPLLHYDYGGTVWPRVGLSHPTIAPYGAFAVKDDKQILVGVQNDGEWKRFATGVLQQPELLEQDCYATNGQRVANRAALEQIVAQVLSTLTHEVAESRMITAQVAYASVNTVAELSTHPHLRRTPVQTKNGQVNIVAPPYQFRGQPRTYGPVPALGEHTDKVRAEFSAQA